MSCSQLNRREDIPEEKELPATGNFYPLHISISVSLVRSAQTETYITMGIVAIHKKNYYLDVRLVRTVEHFE